MIGRDPHSALKTEIVGSSQATGIEFRLVMLQWGREDTGFSLHAAPNSWTKAGIQTTDFLSYLGFRRSRCHFVAGQECYVRWVNRGFALDAFVSAFANGFQALTGASVHLEACCLPLPQPEGYGYFYGKPSGTQSRGAVSHGGGDGHTAAARERLKGNDDTTFSFVLSWLVGNLKGWTFHYSPKHPPLSAELEAAFLFLGLRPFASCPEFDFGPCHCRFAPFESRGDSPFDGNAHYVHAAFDAHAQRFSQGIELLLASQTPVEPFGMKFLPFSAAAEERTASEIERRLLVPRAPKHPSRARLQFDVAISFAGSERKFAERLGEKVREGGFAVFCDAFYPEELWGKDLVVFFDEIYRKAARYCVIFVSRDYVDREWTNHERRSAQARALRERGQDYILPIKVDESELPGMPPTVGYLSLSEVGIDRIAEILVKKLQS